LNPYLGSGNRKVSPNADIEERLKMKVLKIGLVAAFLLGMLALAAPAGAKGSYPPDVKGTIIHRGGIGPTQPDVQPDVLARPTNQPGILPFTGADLTRIVLIGFVTIAAGTVLVRRYRTQDLS
jgi:hypothetical protein